MDIPDIHATIMSIYSHDIFTRSIYFDECVKVIKWDRNGTYIYEGLVIPEFEDAIRQLEKFSGMRVRQLHFLKICSALRYINLKGMDFNLYIINLGLEIRLHINQKFAWEKSIFTMKKDGIAYVPSTYVTHLDAVEPTIVMVAYVSPEKKYLLPTPSTMDQVAEAVGSILSVGVGVGNILP